VAARFPRRRACSPQRCHHRPRRRALHPRRGCHRGRRLPSMRRRRHVLVGRIPVGRAGTVFGRECVTILPADVAIGTDRSRAATHGGRIASADVGLRFSGHGLGSRRAAIGQDELRQVGWPRHRARRSRHHLDRRRHRIRRRCRRPGVGADGSSDVGFTRDGLRIRRATIGTLLAFRHAGPGRGRVRPVASPS
jgi:hypothetical protein